MPPINILSKDRIPPRLLRTHPAPKRLYIRGDLPSLNDYKCLAVVGARRYSPYGAKVCRTLIEGLSNYPVIIISGLAIGIDSIAHEAALDSGLITIAVPGSGLNEDILYPQSKRPLARKIIEGGGCLISEYAPDTRADVWTFPERNRIMAGLADAVLIIEAEQKSGTLITARIALDYNKEVFAVPGDIFSPLSKGPHFLLKQGAIPISSSRGIIEGLGLIWYEKEEPGSSEQAKDILAGCSPEEKEIISLLPLSRNEIIRSLERPAHHIQSTLSLLEIKGMIKEEAGIIHTTCHPGAS